MKAADLFSTAWSNLRRRKGRTALTAAGVVVGVATLVLIVSLGLGLQREVVRPLQSEESLRTLVVQRADEGKKSRGPVGMPFGMGTQLVPVTDKDVEAIAALPGVATAKPELGLLLIVEFEEFEGRFNHEVAGVSPAEEARYAEALVHGRMWKPGEKGVLVPRSFLENRLKAGPETVLGKPVVFRSLVRSGAAAEAPKDGDGFVVTGIFDADRLGFRGARLSMPLDQALDLRRRKGMHPLLGIPTGAYLGAEVRVAEVEQVGTVADRLRRDGYEVVTTSELLGQINIAFLFLELFLGCISGIGLVVSLFGIANTMAMAVLERTREIGILKSLGARDRDVGRLFLVEAASIGLLGGLAGLALGAFAGMVVDVVAHAAAEDLPARVRLVHVPSWLAAGAVLFAVLVSVVAGALPARRASRLDPVTALRYE